MCNATRLFVLTVILAMTAVLNLNGQFEPAGAATAPATAEDTPNELSQLKANNQELYEALRVERDKVKVADKGLQEANESAKAWKVEAGTWKIRFFACLCVIFVLFGVIGLSLWLGRKRQATDMNRGAHVLAILFLFGAGIANAQICYNTKTGNTPGSVKQSVAIVGQVNEFVCTRLGAVEIVKLDGSALITPTITKPTPLTFTFNPTAAGRAIIKIAGKEASALIIVADPDQAFLVGSAIDLAASRVSSSDVKARAAAATANKELVNVNGRLAGLEGKVSVIADAHNSLESRVKAMEVTPAYDDSAIKAELGAARAAHNELVDKLDQLTATQAAMGKDLSVVNTKADQALEQIGELKFTTLKFGTRGEKRALRHLPK